MIISEASHAAANPKHKLVCQICPTPPTSGTETTLIFLLLPVVFCWIRFRVPTSSSLLQEKQTRQNTDLWQRESPKGAIVGRGGEIPR